MLGSVDLCDVALLAYYLLRRLVLLTMGLIPNNKVLCDEQKSVFCGDLPQPLLPGHCIEVTGAPLENCTR